MKLIYNYRENINKQLVDFLKENNIKFKEININDLNLSVLAFSIVGDSKMENKLAKLVKNQPIIDVQYSKNELEVAKFLQIIPTQQIIDIVNEASAFKFECQEIDKFGIVRTNHKQQINPFQIKKIPNKKKNTAFYSSTLGFGEIFSDSRIKKLSETHNLKGISFDDIYDKKGDLCDNFYQLTAKNKISIDDIEMGHGEKTLNCPKCGKKQIVVSQPYQLNLKLNNDLLLEDFISTDNIFGEGIPEPYYFISQRFYQILCNNKLLGNVRIIPINIKRQAV